MIFTRDNLWHALAAIILTPLIGPGGTTAVFIAREMEQAASAGLRWRPWLWTAHKHFEWIVPTAVAWVLAGAVALVRSLPVGW